jgi:hypothetical protein
LQRAEIRSVVAVPPPSMNAVWRTIRNYILWSYERGTLHYDIMVTIILIFIFFSPYWINFNDKPKPRNAHPTDVVVAADAQGRLLYQIDAVAIAAGDDSAVRAELLHVIEPISGHVSIVSYEAVTDHGSHVQSYKVLVQRQ